MSIPLDQLYHYIDQCAEQSYGDPALIYRFDPHGSKNLNQLDFLNDYSVEDILISPPIYCYDQEPLDYQRYETESRLSPEKQAVAQQAGDKKKNLRDYPQNIWDHAILLHSEQRSQNVELYQQNYFVPVYYWSHAVISRDWFRGAEFLDKKFDHQQKTFLIYNRAWSGTREYRLKFADYMISANLVEHCQMTVSPKDSECRQHYKDYVFMNHHWRPSHCVENYFPANRTASSYSAVFDLNDYSSTCIEIVLETLFDDDRLHLTEKTLRPIACAQPFVLCATHGSLAYLRRYGFETYSDVWSESYDEIQDPQSRLQAVSELMKQIAGWDSKTRQHKLALAQEIAKHNQQHFFSKNFLNLVLGELQTNLDRAFAQLLTISDSQQWLSQQWLDTHNFSYQVNAQLGESMLNGFSSQDWNNMVQRISKIVSKHTI